MNIDALTSAGLLDRRACPAWRQQPTGRAAGRYASSANARATLGRSPGASPCSRQRRSLRSWRRACGSSAIELCWAGCRSAYSRRWLGAAVKPLGAYLHRARSRGAGRFALLDARHSPPSRPAQTGPRNNTGRGISLAVLWFHLIGIAAALRAATGFKTFYRSIRKGSTPLHQTWH